MFFVWKTLVDDEEICLETKRIEEKRPGDRPREYNKFENCELDINELQDFNDILKVDQWYSEHYIRFYLEIPHWTENEVFH